MKIPSFLLGLTALVALGSTALAQTSNTIVRFHFYRGTAVIGDVDVEMFDSDKPVTVSNFLMYVRSGAYHNLLLNRCVPGFVIQSGGLWTPSPLSASPFLAGPTANFGPITNEFDVGPRLSNTFGTIAMARVGGETNSASSDWFFNLADNSAHLDNVDGGFTVFGRMLSGSNTLDFFNHPSPRLNILNLGGSYQSLPVLNPLHNCSGTTLANCPRYNELYHIKVSVLPIDPADVKPPTITITSPAQNAKFTNGLVTFSGTASDDHGVTSVYYSITGRPLTNAPGGSHWSFTQEVPAGPNQFYVTSVDAAGQRSTPVTRNFFFSVPETLHVINVGLGSVVGPTNGQRIEIGRSVTLTAKPGPGQVFAGWSGSYIYGAPTITTITFPMHTNATLIATFVPNPFPRLKGTYSGLFFNPDVATQPNGAITFSVTDLGRVTGKLNVVGRGVPFSGALSAYGAGEISVSAASAAPLFGVPSDWTIRFNLDATNFSDQVFPPNSDNPGYAYVWNPDATFGFSSRMDVYRVRPGTALAPSTFTGKYTLAIPTGVNPPALIAPDALANVSNLVVRLVNHADSISQYLWGQFSPEVTSVLTNSQAALSEQESNLVVALNQIIQGSSIYDPARFAGIPLSAETLALAAKNPSGAELIRLNRLLLVDAYPFFIPGPPPLHPEGDSYAAVTVRSSGTGSIVGTLADGTAFTQSAPVGTNGLWPFYTGLYSGRGWMFGWLQFDFSQPADDLHGSMHWLRAGPFPGKPYPVGFEIYPPLTGSRYSTATSTNRVLNFTDGVLALAGPNLAVPSTNHVRFATNNTVLNLDSNKLTFTLVRPSGLFSGTVNPAGETRSIPFKGALLPKQNYGSGYYLSTNQSGRVYFGP